MQVSIRELKANPSRAIAMTRTGQRVQITSHRKVVAELVQPVVVPHPPAVLSDDEVMQRLIASGCFAHVATEPFRLPKPVIFEPSPDGKNMSDFVIELRGPK